MPSSLHKTTSTFASSLYLNGPLLHLSAFTASARRGCVKAGLEQRSLQQRATTIFYCKTSSQRGLFQARFKSYGLNKNRININPTHAKAAGEEVGIYKTYKKGVFCFMSNQLCVMMVVGIVQLTNCIFPLCFSFNFDGGFAVQPIEALLNAPRRFKIGVNKHIPHISYYRSS